ncbi:uncharacterized protein CANTADRAFT_260054 [Suhomyces tanzawaensis NRRL Y-17324]|uniref:Uncharacterized protein n=1 Tax=Suhomyces tanzawaensis NRRL Y-17324 TaxID=984487 RepID=A0A1E4SJ08_9ASCO|nr:uncharacterized protein CANTADRAFT_260054 [Suhomyces tanzawaensis NRRL Y-17324]ODV79496.1 hypothetical protein CANTADRAFT_260054 [Suhomyces tanzawaensis NRRL Y-17324]
MKHDNSSKQVLSPQDLPPTIPAGLKLDALDLTHAVASYRPSTFEPWDLPSSLPVFDKAGRLKRPRKGDRRVVSMPVIPHTYSPPPSPAKDLPSPPLEQDPLPSRPPLPKKELSKNPRAVSMYVLPRIMSRVADPLDSPESAPSGGLSPIASVPTPRVVTPVDSIPLSPVRMAPTNVPRIMEGIKVSHNSSRAGPVAIDLGLPMKTLFSPPSEPPLSTATPTSSSPLRLEPAMVAYSSPAKSASSDSRIQSSSQHFQPPIVWKSPSRLDRSLLPPSPPAKNGFSVPDSDSPVSQIHPYAIRSTDHTIAYPKVRKNPSKPQVPEKKPVQTLASPHTTHSETSPLTSIGSADLDEIYKYYGSIHTPDFHIPKHLVIDDDNDSLFSESLSIDESFVASESKSLSSAASSLVSHEHALHHTEKSNKELDCGSETSSILPSTFEEAKLEDFLSHEPELGVHPDDISLKDSLFSGMDLEFESFREPNRTVSVPMLPYLNRYLSSVSVNTNKDLPSVPIEKKSETSSKEQQPLQVRKCRNLKSYQRKALDRYSVSLNLRYHLDRLSVSSSKAMDRQSRQPLDRHSIQFSSNQSQWSVSSRSTKLNDAKSDLQAYVRQRPFSFCLDSGSDYSYSKYGLVSSVDKRKTRPRSYSQSDKRSASFNIKSRNSLNFEPSAQATSQGSIGSGQSNLTSLQAGKSFRSVSDFGDANRSMHSFKSPNLHSRGFGSSHPYSQDLKESIWESSEKRDSSYIANTASQKRSVSDFTSLHPSESFHTAPTSPTGSNKTPPALKPAISATSIAQLPPTKSPTRAQHSFTSNSSIDTKPRNVLLPNISGKANKSKALPSTPERQNRFGDRARYLI